jgi:PEP-CTERM motif
MNGGSSQVWQQFAVDFTATSANTTISFVNGDPRFDNTNGLDNVSLVLGSAPPPTGVPEPVTLSLLGLGLAGLGFMRWRKAS